MIGKLDLAILDAFSNLKFSPPNNEIVPTSLRSNLQLSRVQYFLTGQNGFITCLFSSEMDPALNSANPASMVSSTTTTTTTTITRDQPLESNLARSSARTSAAVDPTGSVNLAPGNSGQLEVTVDLASSSDSGSSSGTYLALLCQVDPFSTISSGARSINFTMSHTYVALYYVEN